MSLQYTTHTHSDIDIFECVGVYSFWAFLFSLRFGWNETVVVAAAMWVQLQQQ